MLTKEQARLYLAGKLPQRIKIREKFNVNGSTAYFIKLLNRESVLPMRETEWHEIARIVLKAQSIQVRQKVCELLGCKYDYCAWIDAGYVEISDSLKRSL